MKENKIFESIEKEIINDVRGNQLSRNFENLCIELLNHYRSQYFQIKDQFRKALNIYTFDYLAEHELVTKEDYIHVFLSLEQSCKDTYICLDEGGGIHDLDFELGKISKEPPLEFYDELNYFDSLSEEFDEWDKFHTKILLTILSQIWIELEGFKKGIVMKTNENSTVQQFFFNDLKWNKKSKFFNNIHWMKSLKDSQITKVNTHIIYQMVNEK